jgi:hypothetical protein
MPVVFHGRNSDIRIYDGTTGGTPPGPFYFRLPFEQVTYRGPMGRNRPDQRAKLDRGILNSDSHFIQLSDEAILTAIPITFTIELLDTNHLTVFAALSNLFRASPWTVGNQTWTNTNRSTQIRNGDGTLVTTPDTAEPTEDRVNIEVRLIKKSATGANDLVLHWNEVWFPPNQDFQMGMEASLLNITGLWKGDLTKSTAFTVGTDTTA